MTGADATPAYSIEQVHGLPREERAAIAKLHAELLPNSPIVLLGMPILRDFYYGLLADFGLIRVVRANVYGRLAGFCAYTNDPNGFMGSGLRRWWYRLAWNVGVSVLAKPSRVAALWEAFQIMSSRGADAGVPEGTGEILSLGVAPEFTDPGFVRKTGLRIARDLIQHAVDDLTALGTPNVAAIVDADNRVAQMMYHGLGWRLTRKAVPGWRVPSVEFTRTTPAEDDVSS